jgi:hypothetical protein
MEDVGKLYGPLVYFTAIWYILCIFWYILWLFGIFNTFWHVVPRKIWQLWTDARYQILAVS